MHGLSPTQQHHIARMAPEARNAYLIQLRNQQYRSSMSTFTPNIGLHNVGAVTLDIAPPLATIHEPPQKKRRGGPRKCNNPSCDRIVTKRNFCYKCQKRKERGLPMGPLLPSVSHMLQNQPQETNSDQLPPLNLMNSQQPQPQPRTTAALQSFTQSKCVNASNSGDEKMAQLHNYLLGLAGSEAKAKELIEDYMKQNVVDSKHDMPRAYREQQNQQTEQSTRYY